MSVHGTLVAERVHTLGGESARFILCMRTRKRELPCVMSDECAWYLGGERVVSERSSSHTSIQLQYIMANMSIWPIRIPYMSQIYIYYTYMTCKMYSRRRTCSEQMMRQLHTSRPSIYMHVCHTCICDIYMDERYTYITRTWDIWYILGGKHATSKRCGSYT